MAYGLRLRLEHHDFLGKLNRFDILERDYAGVADIRTLEGEEPCRISWGDRSNEEYSTIYGSEAVLRFFADFDMEFLYLFTADSKKYRLDHSIDGVLFWSGFVEPESWGEPLTATPYQVEVTATDGLGALKKKYYPTQTGRKTILEIIVTLMGQTGISLPINTCVDWVESLQATGSDPLTQHYKTVASLATLDSYNVLERQLPGCRIMQRLGQWWIISYTAMANDTITYFKYDASGNSIGTGVISVMALDYWIEGEPQLEILPAIKEMVVVHDYGYNANLIQNGSFGAYNKENEEFAGWENMGGVEPQQWNLNDKKEKFVVIPGMQFPASFDDEGYGLVTNGIKKGLEVIETDSIINFGLKYGILSNYELQFFAYLLFIRIRLISSTSSNIYYLQRTPYVEKDQKFEWALVDGGTSQGAQHITLGSHLEPSKASGHKDEYYNTFDRITPWPMDKIADHFEDFRATVFGIPESGTIEIELLVPYAPVITPALIIGSCYTGVTIEMLTEEMKQYPTQQSYKIINDTNNNYKPEDKELKVGDYPDIVNAAIIYRNGYQRADKSHTTAWSIPGSGSYPFAELVGRMIVAQQRAPRQVYDIRMQGIVPSLGLIIEDINKSGRRLLENGIAYDNGMGAIEGNYTELPTIDIDSLTVEVATEFDENPEHETVEMDANPQNIEDRVTVKDLKGATISSSSYMDGDYFESIIGEDGFGRIRPRRRPVVIEFIDQVNPKVLNYAEDYEPMFGQYPVVTLYTVDESGNRVQRSELAYFIIDPLLGITSIEFTPFAEGAMTGFILLV